MSIKADHVTKIYGKEKALNNVSFEVNTGDILGFIGPNGAGKSTMMKILTGYIPQTSGEVFIDGIKVRERSVETRIITGYLPENNPLYLDMYVKEYLLFVSGIYKIKDKEKRVNEIMEKTGLMPEKKKKIMALSKGYRQRVGLSQALIHDPKVLILDEPTSGLDPNQIEEIRNLVSGEGTSKTIMLSTHIMQEVEAICDKIIIIDKGKIVADDCKQNIYSKSADHSVTIVVEFNKAVSEKALLKISGINKVLKVSETNFVVESASDKDIREDIFQFAVKNQLSVLSMQKKEKRLEDVFRELTKDKK
jgi:ABC-2 type transport system ATP-binding protein